MTAPSRRSLIWIGAIAYLLFTLVTFPAGVAASLLPDNIEMGGVSGTLWSGTARAIRVDDMVGGETRWRLQPLALLMGRLQANVDLQLEGGALAGRVAATPGGRIYLKDIAGIVPLSFLSGVIPTSLLDGRIGLDIAHATLESQWPIDAAGTVDLVGLQIVSPVQESLGHFEIQFEGVGDESLDGTFRDVQANVTAQGKLHLYADRRWQLTGKVSATASTSSQLRQALALVGPRDTQGNFTLSMSGDL